MTFRVLGCDPGVTNPGAAVLERDAQGWRLVESPTLRSLEQFFGYLVQIGRVELRCVCVEDLTWLGAVRANDGHGSAQIVRVVGAAQLFAAQRRIPFVEVRPQAWRKRIAGSGRATKEQVRKALRRLVSGVPERFGLNRSDAAAIALAGALGRGRG